MNRLVYGICIICLSLSDVHVSLGALQYDLKSLYRQTDSCCIDERAACMPVIGISTNYNNGRSDVADTYVQAVLRSGGIPVLIPVITDDVALRSLTSSIDGLVMVGGEDVNPLWFGEEPHPRLGEVIPVRDLYELKLIKLATDRNIPVLGVCRGEQLINVAFGGTLIQDINSQVQSAIKHKQDQAGTAPSHKIGLESGSQLAQIIGTDSAYVNSFHHQSVGKVAPGFKPVAFARDGIVEAIEAWPNRPVMGVQWHPESLLLGGDTVMGKIFCFLTDKAKTFRRAKEIHRRIISLDTHSDTPLCFGEAGFDISHRESNQINIPKMEEGRLDAAFLAAWLRQGKRDDASLQQAVEKATALIESIHEQVGRNSSLCGIATSPDEVLRYKDEGKKAFLIGIENGYAIGKDLSNLARFHDMGVTYMTLCHTYDNDICDTSTDSKREWKGLSPFGEKVVKEMNRLGMMVDLSHASQETFFDTIELSEVPVICSHSSSKALCDHNRNLTDEQLRALAKNGGVVQVCLVSNFLNTKADEACLMDFIEHIDHIVKVAGIDHVGIGSDFDGGGGVTGCNGANDMIQVTVKLLERGYSEEDIAKIWGGNLLRVMRVVQR